MNKIKYIIIAIITGGFVQAQDELNLPNFTPPSPEAAAMTKYADLQANEYMGMLSHTFPLHVYKAGQLEVPISISYNGAGVRVDDIPTWVGINWTLNAGGVITRTVYDVADEYANSRVFHDSDDVTYYSSNAIDGTADGQYLKNLAFNDQIDTEVDIFQFNFNGYSGSFYLNEYWNGELLEDTKNFKITVNNRNDFYNQKYIYITTPDGVKYTFGGINATEETALRYVINGSMTQGDTNQGTTAFYLITIEHPIHGSVEFEYLSLNQEIFIKEKQYKRKKFIEKLDADLGCGCMNYPSEEEETIITTISSRVVNPKYLHKITSSNTSENITFNSNRIENSSFKRVLKSIIIDRDADEFNLPFKTIDFSYSGLTNYPTTSGGVVDCDKRFFLTTVVFNKDFPNNINTVDGRRNEVYEFQYNNPNGLPNMFSHSQDFAGFFNGINNTSSIPDNSFYNPYDLQNYADRTPNFVKASYGTLERIYYPTGGYSYIEYEPLTLAKKKRFKSISLWAYRNMQQYTQPEKLSDGVPQIDENGNYIGIQNVYENQPVSINVKLRAYLTNGTIAAQNERATLTITDLTTSEVESHLLAMNSATNNLNNVEIIDQDFSINYNFVQGHNYGIEINVFQAGGQSSIPLEATVFVKYNDGYDVIDNYGVRLKRVTDYSSDGLPENIKRYYYSSIDEIGNIVVENLNFIDEIDGFVRLESYVVNDICQDPPDCGGGLGAGPREFGFKFSNLLSSKISFEEQSTFEIVSISYGGDDFEKGGIEKFFSKYPDYGLTKISTNPYPGRIPVSIVTSLISDEFVTDFRRRSFYNGNLFKEKVYLKKDNSLLKTKESNYTYDILDNNVPIVINFTSKKELIPIWFGDSVNINNAVTNYTLGFYKTESLRNELTQKQTIEYIDPVPLGVTDESTYNKIVSVEDYQYDSYNGLPTKITTSTSDGSLVEVNNFYVDQVTSPDYLTGLTSDQIQAAQELQNKHIIGAPILTQKVKNSKTISKVKTIYQDIDSNPNNAKIVPAVIQSDKGDDLETSFENRVIFHEYNSFGKPTLVSLSNGTKTAYWYNGLGQVIMKIDNFIPGSGGTIDPDDIIDGTATSPCGYLDSAFGVDAQVTLYKYEPITNLLIEIRDTKCNVLYYEYDPLHRLQFIKDKDGNILQEFDLSFKRY